MASNKKRHRKPSGHGEVRSACDGLYGVQFTGNLVSRFVQVFYKIVQNASIEQLALRYSTFVVKLVFVLLILNHVINYLFTKFS